MNKPEKNLVAMDLENLFVRVAPRLAAALNITESRALTLLKSDGQLRMARGALYMMHLDKNAPETHARRHMQEILGADRAEYAELAEKLRNA